MKTIDLTRLWRRPRSRELLVSARDAGARPVSRGPADGAAPADTDADADTLSQVQWRWNPWPPLRGGR